MPAGKGVDVEVQPVGGDAALKLEWKEPVVAASNDTCGHVRPRLQRPRISERPVRLLRLASPQGFSDNVLGDVVEELGHDVKFVADRPAITRGLGGAGSALIGVGPPGPAGLPRCRDHGVDEHKLTNRAAGRDQWR